MKIASNIGQVIEPQSVTKITDYVVRINYDGLDSQYVAIDKLSPRLRKLMV